MVHYTSSSESTEQLLSQLKQMELGVSHEQSLSSSTPIIDNIFDKYNKNLVPIRSLSDHDTSIPNIPPPSLLYLDMP